MENLDSIFAELFDGATSVRDSVGGIASRKPVPDVAVLDDPLQDFQKSTGAADSLCKQLESDALISELMGDTYDLAGEIFTPSTLEIIGRNRNPSRTEPEFSKLFDAWKPEIDFGKFVKDIGFYADRSASLQKQEPRRRRELREIVDSTLGQFVVNHAPERLADPIYKADTDACFGRIVDSMYKITHQMLMGAE
jgi:hypothetical protein